MKLSAIGLSLRAVLLASAGAVIPLGHAQAQQSPPAAAVEEIVVTGTRLNISSYRQPTPVTVVGLEKLETDNHTDLASVITQLPAVGPSANPNSSVGQTTMSSGVGGMSLVSLRDRGAARTLVLFDGKRVASSVVDGGTDLNMLPASLVQRIDIVTGGASAAWGSDAVSGVVNVILNKQFSGWMAHVEGASNERGTRQTAKAELSFGAPVLGGRGRVILSGALLHSPDAVLQMDTPWYKSQSLVINPAATATNNEPRLIRVDRAGFSQMTQGGLISAGPLRGIQFVEGGRPIPFEFGQVSGPVQVGGTFVSAPDANVGVVLTSPVESQTLFGYFSYDLTDKITASFELNYAHTNTKNSATTYSRPNNVPIQIDNPFLDAGIVARMQQLGITSFNLGTTNTNNSGPGEPFAPGTVGKWASFVERELTRQVLSFTGPLQLFGAWDWNLDFQHSKNLRTQDLRTNPIVARYNQAVDAVRVTTANVGASGLTPGSIACRSTLTAPTNGCVPLNVLGINVASPQAIAWVNGGDAVSDLTFEQYTVGGALRGEPLSLPAGPVSVALGFDYRWDSNRQTVDPLAIARAYSIGNPQPIDVHQSSMEAFGEVNVPLLSDQFVQSLDANAAGRWIDYSSSGRMFAWKLGLTSQVTEDVRLRGTVSRDIRAPGLNSLYDTGSSIAPTIADPWRNNTPTAIVVLTRGNPNLEAEVAKTYAVGLVLSPRFIPGLNASVDWYSIDIKGAIGTPGQNLILQECYVNNNPLYCALVVRTNGVLTQLRVSPINANSEKTFGYDFQLDYRRPMLGGDVAFSVMGNKVLGSRTIALGLTSYSADVAEKATAALTYRRGRFSGTVQGRGLGPARIRSDWGPRDVDENRIPPMAYLDLRASYRFGANENIQAYAALDNVMGTNPPIVAIPYTSADPLSHVATRTNVYDFLGRSYRVGVRARF